VRVSPQLVSLSPAHRKYILTRKVNDQMKRRASQEVLLHQEGYGPLYRRVCDYIVQNISAGTWKAGDCLPNEQLIANELKVSIGTVRKALDVLASERLLSRRQGRGTFVAETTAEDSLIRFFRLEDASGRRPVPASASEVIRVRPSKAAEERLLDLQREEPVYEINRVRLCDGVACCVERIVVPRRLVPGIDTHVPFPNALYATYQRDYGIHVVRADERISAVLATRTDQRLIGVEVGSPILRVERVAIAVGGRPVELRTKRCATGDLEYVVSLS
jgi:GntR family transcriptional regulator